MNKKKAKRAYNYTGYTGQTYQVSKEDPVRCGRCSIVKGGNMRSSIEKQYPVWVEISNSNRWTRRMELRQESTPYRCDFCYQDEKIGKTKGMFLQNATNASKYKYKKYFSSKNNGK